MEKLNALRKQKIRAVILLEAVVSLAIFASIATLLLGQIQKNRQEEAKILQTEEALRVAKMALQTGQNITFDRTGGNSSLAKVEFQTSKGAIRYQLYLGNGKIKRIKETKN